MLYIDTQSRIPVYRQLEEGILELIRLGVYPPGAQLPSVRSLAVELGINPNTIQKAYQELEAAGVTTSVPGRGSFVGEADTTLRRLKEGAFARFLTAAREAVKSGATRPELDEGLNTVFSEVRKV